MQRRVSQAGQLLLCVSIAVLLPRVAVADDVKPYSGPAPSDRTPPALFKAYCQNCHGPTLQGDGPLAKTLSVRVPDLARGMRLSSGAEGSPGTAADVQVVLERGIPNSPMPSYAGLLSKTELVNLARHVVTLMKGEPGASPLDVGPPLELTPDNVMDGAILYAKAGCAQCHGFDGRGGVEAFVARENDDGSPARFPKLTHPITWRGPGAAKDIAQRIARGIPGSPMPAYRPALKESDIWKIALYVETLAEVTTQEQLARQWVESSAEEDPALHGAHLLDTMTCVYCHRTDGRTKDARVQAFDVGPLGTFSAGPMLPRSVGTDPANNVAALKNALVDGEGFDGRRLMPLTMPWTHLMALSDGDITALTRALEARPRAQEAAPGPRHAGWLDQFMGKLTAAAALRVVEMKVVTNPESSEGLHPRWVAAGVLAVAAGITFIFLVMALGGPKRSRRRRSITAFTPMPIGAALAGLMLWPGYELRPRSILRSAMHSELPGLSGISDEGIRKIALRGQQLVAQAPCAVCHTAQNPYRFGGESRPLAGGMRVRSAEFGRVFASNLTTDDTGIGSFSRDELRRAIRGGIGKDGRVMHPEAMPYNLSAAYTDEELEAIITYLKAVPPVNHRIPAPELQDELDGIAFSLFDYGE